MKLRGRQFATTLARQFGLRPSPSRRISKTIVGRNNVLTCDDAILSAVSVDIHGSGNTLTIGPRSQLTGVTFRIRGDNHRIAFGEECVFKEGCSIWMEDCGGTLVIGRRSTFDGVHLAVTEDGSTITIGDDCMFAYDIDVRTGDSHSIISTVNQKRVNAACDVFIGDHVWVAAHAIVLKGVHIAGNSVIATGSVVTKRFDSRGVVIAGNPARIVKDGITWSRDRIQRA